jgi:hypothetical protein
MHGNIFAPDYSIESKFFTQLYWLLGHAEFNWHVGENYGENVGNAGKHILLETVLIFKKLPRKTRENSINNNFL